MEVEKPLDPGFNFQSTIPIVAEPTHDISHEPPISVQMLLGEHKRRTADSENLINCTSKEIMNAIQTAGGDSDEWAQMTLWMPARYGEEALPGIDTFSRDSDWKTRYGKDDGIRSFNFTYHIDEITYRPDGGWIFKPMQECRLFHCDGVFMYAIVQVAVYPNGCRGRDYPHMNANIYRIPIIDTSMHESNLIVRELQQAGHPLGLTHIFQPYSPREHSIDILKKHKFTDQQIFHLDLVIFLHRISRCEGYLPLGAALFMKSILKILEDGEYEITFKGKPRKVHWGVIETIFCEDCRNPSLANESVVFIHFAEMYKSSPEKCSRDKFIRVREQTYRHCLQIRW